ncbi:hypothetical protein ACSAZK_01785 [Methanosarcina sp. Mfa9]|uniref:hypothetical protein n=1 Tax=Methanosarcina sp. Mfa9 TaxID=3439063 RepID=UPI003F841013
MKQLLSTSPEPIFRVEKDGKLLYANEAGVPLLEIWGIRIGEQLPENVACFILKVLREREPRNLVVKGGEKEYSLMFKPLDEEFVHIHWINFSSRKPDEEKPRLQEHQQRVLSRLGELSLSSAGNQTLLNDSSYGCFCP